MGRLSAIAVCFFAPFMLRLAFSQDVFNHSLRCEDLPDNSTLKDFRPCEQEPIKAILTDGRCDYREIDESR